VVIGTSPWPARSWLAKKISFLYSRICSNFSQIAGLAGSKVAPQTMSMSKMKGEVFAFIDWRLNRFGDDCDETTRHIRNLYAHEQRAQPLEPGATPGTVRMYS